MGIIRKFFWSMASSAALMILSATMNGPKLLMDKLAEFKNMQKQISVSRAMANAPKSPPNTAPKTPEIHTTLEMPDEPEAPATTSSSDMEYLIDGKKYVFIQGHYIEARKDNIYMVNGQKVFYVNNRGRRDRPKESETSSDMAASLNPANLMLQVQKTQMGLKERDKYLNDLMKQEPGEEQ